MFWKLPKIINVLVFFLFYFISVHVYLALIDELRLHGFNFRPATCIQTDHLKNILHITHVLNTFNLNVNRQLPLIYRSQ